MQKWTHRHQSHCWGRNFKGSDCGIHLLWLFVSLPETLPCSASSGVLPVILSVSSPASCPVSSKITLLENTTSRSAFGHTIFQTVGLKMILGGTVLTICYKFHSCTKCTLIISFHYYLPSSSHSASYPYSSQPWVLLYFLFLLFTSLPIMYLSVWPSTGAWETLPVATSPEERDLTLCFSTTINCQ